MLRIGIRAGAVLDAKSFAEQVRARGEVALRELQSLGADTFNLDEVVAQFSELATRLAPYISDTVNLLHDAKDRDATILLEGAQATFLDIDHGTYPFVTSSNPVSGGATVGTGLGPRDIDRVIGIAKAYTTRVGSGPFPSELTNALGDALVDIGKEYGTVTGRRRRTGWLDTVMLKHAVRLNSLTEIALTKLDVLDTFDEVKVCVGYRKRGETITSYPDRSEELAAVEAVYETLPGWKTDTVGVQGFDELPAAAQKLVSIVERETGVPVTFIGTGPARDAVVRR